MNNAFRSLSDMKREAYLASKEASDLFFQKRLHHTWEKLGDKGVSALGRIFKTTAKKVNSVFNSILSGASGAAIILSNQTSILNERLFGENNDLNLTKIYLHSADAEAPLPAKLPDTMSSNFVLASEPTYVSPETAEHLKVKAEYTRNKAHGLLTGTFQTVMTPDEKTAVDRVRSLDPNNVISFQLFESGIFTKAGLAKLDSPTDALQVAANTLYLTALEQQFAPTASGKTVPVWTYREVTPITSATALETRTPPAPQPKPVFF